MTVPGDYAVLAPIYDDIGMSEFARRMTPMVMDYALHTDWLGRRIYVLGCGTGTSVEYLSQYSYAITGIDNSSDMLDIARRKLSDTGANVKWQQQDIRELNGQTALADLVLALNVMNELNSLRDLETVFTGVHHLLDSEKLFVFDLHTVQGLTEDGLSGDSIIHDDPNRLTVFASNDYDYERQMSTCRYIIFKREDEHWARSEAQRILRTFPVQAVASLLQRCGFTVNRILQLNFDTYEPGISTASRVVFIAQKP